MTTLYQNRGDEDLGAQNIKFQASKTFYTLRNIIPITDQDKKTARVRGEIELNPVGINHKLPCHWRMEHTQSRVRDFFKTQPDERTIVIDATVKDERLGPQLGPD